jgi:hypothetical protein
MDNKELDRQIRQAKKHTKKWLQSNIATKKAWYDDKKNAIKIKFNNAIEISIPVNLIEELNGVDKNELSEIRINPLRNAIYWEKLNIYIDSYGLVLNHLDAKTWAYRYIGSQSGKVKSEAKAKAVRENGKKGGRPITKIPAYKKLRKSKFDEDKSDIIQLLSKGCSSKEIALKIGKNQNSLNKYISSRRLREQIKAS